MPLDRKSELDEMKRLNLSVVASAFGYEIDRKKSTRHSVLMSNGSDKIIVSQKGDHYVFCSVHDPGSNGTVIDFAQKAIEPGCSLGRVRQILRPFLNSSYLSTIQQRYRGNYASEIKPSELDLAGVAARYSRFLPIDQPHPYLCEVRGVPFELLQSWRLRGRVRHCPKRNSVIFPHWGSPNEKTGERCLVGYEIKSESINMFSKGGQKGLWMSGAAASDRRLAVAESGLDALSYLALRGTSATRVASISGKLNTQQPDLLTAAMVRMGPGTQIVAAFDNDPAGDELTNQLADLVRRTGRNDFRFVEDRAEQRMADWNSVLCQQSRQRSASQAVQLAR